MLSFISLLISAISPAVNCQLSRPVVLRSSKLCHQRVPHDEEPAWTFLGSLTSSAICCLPNKRNLPDHRLNLLSTRAPHDPPSMPDDTRGSHMTLHRIFLSSLTSGAICCLSNKRDCCKVQTAVTYFPPECATWPCMEFFWVA